jgi:hypothetical protein
MGQRGDAVVCRRKSVWVQAYTLRWFTALVKLGESLALADHSIRLAAPMLLR